MAPNKGVVLRPPRSFDSKNHGSVQLIRILVRESTSTPFA
jgi:hypothetical protein